MPANKTITETQNKCIFKQVDDDMSIEEIQKRNPNCSFGRNHGTKTEKQLKMMERLRKKLENKKK